MSNDKDTAFRRFMHFTLIELLVVIAVIALLAALLLPALASAKQKGHMIACSGNLSQAGKAVMLYVNDYDDWILPVRTSGPMRFWMKHMGEYTGGTTAYGAKGKLLICPSGPDEIRTDYNTNYGYNARCGNEADAITSPAYGYVKLGKVSFPTRALLITDQRNVSAPAAGSSNCMKWDMDLFSFPLIDKRHSLGANLLFLDTHVQWGKNIVDNTPCDTAGYYWSRWANSPGQ